MIRGYCRVSSIEQAADEKSSLADQERVIRGVAMMRDLEPVIYVEPGVSGSVPLAEREVGARMLAEARPGDIIVAAKLDRLFRSASDALATVDLLKAKGVKIILVNISSEPVSDNGVGKLFFTMLAAFADFERELIADRVAAGRAGKKARGGHIGGDAPYGFTKQGAGATAVLNPNVDERRVIERMAHLHHETGSYRKTARRLNEEGLQGRQGPWNHKQIVRILGRQA